MLVLTRKANQRITISHPDGEIVVTMIRTVGYDRAQIGITAPPSVRIEREDRGAK